MADIFSIEELKEFVSSVKRFLNTSENINFLRILFLHDNPLERLPSYLWQMKDLSLLRIDSRLASYVPKDAEIVFDRETEIMLQLILAFKHQHRWNQQQLEQALGTCSVYLNRPNQRQLVDNQQ